MEEEEKLEEGEGLNTLVRPYRIQLLPHEIAAAAAYREHRAQAVVAMNTSCISTAIDSQGEPRP